jgi:hypothetical protein
MTTETRTTPAALVSVYGPTFAYTGDRCQDDRPIFRGANGTVACGCSDH